MSSRTINLIAAIVALWLLSTLAAPALYRNGSVAAAICAMVLFIACAAWIVYATHLLSEKWHEEATERGKR